MSDDVSQVWSDRVSIYGPSISVMDDLVGIYLGSLPSEFDDFFHEEMHVHLINSIRLSWDDLASMAGKIFPVYVKADNETAAAKERAERQEKWAYGINDAGRVVGAIDASLLMKVLAWWMVGTGEAVPMVLPDYERKTPFFTFRDPRHYYPPVGWSPYTQADADDALFAYQITLGELKRRWPRAKDEINQKLVRSVSSSAATTTSSDSSPVYVGEYYHADSWIAQTLTDQVITLARSDSGDPGHPGVVPVAPMALYSPGVRARSIFADQISIQAALARMFSQKLDYYDRTLYPVIFTSPLADKVVRVGPWAINEFDPTFQGQFKVEVVAPSHEIDADQTMGFVLGLSRMLNRNPETFQGQAPSGRADSAKALESLKSAIVNTTIRDMLWPPMMHGMARLYAKAATMDVKLWPNERKRTSGRRKNQAFSMMYRPKVDLEGREQDFQIETGRGLGGYQGTLEIVQLVGAELMSEDDALEQLPDVRDAQEAKRSIQAFRAQKIVWANLQARAEAPPGTPGALRPGAMAKLIRMVQSESMDIFEAIEKLEEQGELYETAPPPQTAPLAAAAGAGAGMPAETPLPSLQLLRGGRA